MINIDLKNLIEKIHHGGEDVRNFYLIEVHSRNSIRYVQKVFNNYLNAHSYASNLFSEEGLMYEYFKIRPLDEVLNQMELA